jgi:DNA repair protein RecO (recombination protein O)
LAESSLIQLDDSANVANIVLCFEMQALQILGHLPSLRECVECGDPLVAVPRYYFGMLAGGVLCSACRRGQRSVVSVSAEALGTLRKASEEPGDLAVVNSRTAGEARSIMNQYVTHLLGNRPRMHPYLQAIM